MARIRSIHPGIFTDDAYMSLSFAARELIKGIWCEADDGGIFEWKPLTLKARLMPADAIDMNELLAELVTHRFVKQFEHEGKGYGAVRNFRKYQRPKKPTHSHPLPDDIRTYVGLRADGTEEVPHQFPTKGGKSPQMEDGGKEVGKEERVEAPARRGTRLPPDWTPSPENIAFAETEGFPPHVAVRIADRFRNHWLAKAGREASKLDWNATWRNWVTSDITAREFGGNGAVSQRQAPVGDTELAAQWAARNS